LALFERYLSFKVALFWDFGSWIKVCDENSTGNEILGLPVAFSTPFAVSAKRAFSAKWFLR